jgi:NAD(P)-dependent dehydrogenase (short-subunit alcohol dehydrogenase family)
MVNSDKVFVITGANSGLGFEAALKLASLSATNTVILSCRDADKGERARQAIVKATGNSNTRVMRLDVSSLASVREFAGQFDGPIDALICNAGISRGPARSEDGLDGVFETNHLGHFLLTNLLLEKVVPNGRVISVSSDMHQPPGPKLRWPGVERLAEPGGVSGIHRYSYSKLCNLYFVYELSRRLRAEGSGVAVAAFNPGLMTDTNFVSTPGPFAGAMKRIFASRVGSLDGSGAALAELATRAGDIDGLYFDRTAKASTPSSALSYDEDNARELWDASSRLSGISAG